MASAKKSRPQQPAKQGGRTGQKPSKQQRSAAAATRREQLRAQQEAERRAAQRKMRIIYVVSAVVALAVIAVISVVVINDRNAKREQAERERLAQIDPPSATSARNAFTYNPTKASGVPTVTVYADFQCSACKSFDETHGRVLGKLADQGKVNLEFRVLTFLDQNYGNTYSTQTAQAAACADTVGKFKAYHDNLFATQSGEGWSSEALRVKLPELSGITGENLTKFQSCIDQNATAKWVRESNQNARAGWKGSTPQVDINGKNPLVEADGKQIQFFYPMKPTEAAWLAALEQYA
ncbi:DsbA family protein [Aestuariimicrobium ganziense]|uniref:DsbA family protein n=1 Tax=Aestuariimicrobium ganziense TaxID=2773677 RepID=UPI001943EDCB|nr:thioredoxin domain-containing protein [Aestuariimicrobium ganziense]